MKIIYEATFDQASRVIVASKTKQRVKQRDERKKNIDIDTESFGSGQIQIVQLKNGEYVLRFIDLILHNRKRQHLYVLLCVERVNKMRKRCHYEHSFDQALSVFNPHRFKSIVICKPATAKPPSVVPDVHLYANLVPYAHETEELTLLLRAKANDIVEVAKQESEGNLQVEELSIEMLKSNAHDLFRMFDHDRSGSIEFKEFKAMLAYRKIKLLEPQARRLFALCDQYNRGHIDEQEFVAGLYMTNELRKRPFQPKLSPSDAFAFFDDDRDGFLNFLEFEQTLKCLGVEATKSQLYNYFPMEARLIAFIPFQEVWLKLISIRKELERRQIPIDISHVKPWQRSKYQIALRELLLGSLTKQAQEELVIATEARQVVLEMERNAQLEKQDKDREAYNLKRAEELQIKTEEALKEREEKIRRRKERNAKAKMVQEEKRLLRTIEEEKERRKQHLLDVKTEALVRRRQDASDRRAARGDDTIEWAHRHLNEIPRDVYHGKENLTDLSLLILVNLAFNQLTTLPSEFLYHLDLVQKLDLSHNAIESIPESIGEMTELRILNIRANKLTTLPLTLSKLTRLEILDVSSNNLKSFTVHSMKNFLALHVLYLNDNQLEVLPPDFGALPALQALDLVGNPLSRLPVSFATLKELKQCDISMCGLRYLSMEFGSHPTCTVVNLSRNHLDHLPASVGGLQAVQVVNVACNEIVSLPDSVGNWTSLVALYGDHNRLRLLPEEIGNWNRIEVIHLQQNHIESLPSTIGCMQHLHTLNLRGNYLVNLPLEFGALNSLRHLNLSRNRLTELPVQIGYCHELLSIDLSENSITVLPNGVGMWMALESCILHHNQLKSPLSFTIQDWTSLKYLDLSHNLLQHLDTAICYLPQLECLCLGANRLTYLPADIQAMTSLLTLDIHNNCLRALPTELNILLDSLEVLHVDKNPLTDIPEKWCIRWRLKDVYGTSFSHGYTQAEAVEWVADHAAFYPSVVHVWNQNASLYLEHALPVLSFVAQVKEHCGPLWQKRFSKPVKAAFFEFMYKGHAVLLEEIPSDTRQEHSAIEREREEIRDSRAEEAKRVDMEYTRQVAEKYNVNKVQAEIMGQFRYDKYQRKVSYETHIENTKLLAMVSVKAKAAKERETIYKEECKHQFASEMIERALLQENELQRNYSQPDQSKWHVFHRLGQFLGNNSPRDEAIDHLSVSVGLFIVFSVLFYTDFVSTTRLENPCAMTYSSPVYTKLEVRPSALADPSLLHTFAKYTLSTLHMDGDDRYVKHRHKYDGVPVLFVPGHLGSYKQARSYGQHLYELYRDSGNSKISYDFFLVDFNEEATGFTGYFMAEQGFYINEAIKKILNLYDAADRPTSVVVIAHSMGGIAVRTAMTLPNYVLRSIHTIVTLSTPHLLPPFPLDAKMVEVYSSTNAAWKEFTAGCNTTLCAPFGDVVVVSLAGGHRDFVIHSSVATLDQLVPPSNGIALLTSSIPSVGASMDHLCLLWCHQLLKTITTTLVALIDPATGHVIHDKSVRLTKLKSALIGNIADDAILVVPGFSDQEREKYFIKTPQFISDLTRTHYTLAFPILFAIALAIFVTQLENWQLQLPEYPSFTQLLPPSRHLQYPIDNIGPLSTTKKLVGGGILIASAAAAYLVNTFGNIATCIYVYFYIIGCLYCLSRVFGKILRPLSYSVRLSKVFKPSTLLATAVLIVFTIAHGWFLLGFDASRELALVFICILAVHLFTWLSLLVLPSPSKPLSTYQATVFALYGAVLPCWLGEAVYYLDVVRFPRVLDFWFIYSLLRTTALVLPCLAHAALARKYYFPLPPSALFARSQGIDIPTSSTSLMEPEECTGCFIEDGGPGAIFIEATTSETKRYGNVTLGPTFRVASCDCGVRFESIKDYCEFCKRLCSKCGGGELAREQGRQYREYMYMMHEQVIAHQSVSSLLWLLLFGGMGYALAMGTQCLVYIGAVVGIVATSYHMGLAGPWDVEDGNAVSPKSAEPLMHEVKKQKQK
ncbi:hypothetical protein THRCLA_05979 [Thraustotheca clavata]|uniref:GPI inositol-deacylase n=1 Tax=Thraustotheca clavata TaxID=74557 RepID=A0A1V9ZQR3_9STRA|nr:hypothetical protein THRCLA_05979 [Thraustotheca clavata]